MLNKLNSRFNFLKLEDVQRLRLRRMSIALVGGLVLTVICLIFYQQRLLRLNEFQLASLIAGFWVVNVLFVLSILTGLNKKLKDPSLTVPQMIWAITTTMVAIYYSNDLRTVLLMLSLLVIIFGSLYLSERHLVYFIWYTMFCYLTVLTLLFLHHPLLINFEHELIIFTVYALVLIIYAALAQEFIGMRKHAHDRTRILKNSLLQVELKSLTDELTGIANRRFMLSLLDRERLITTRKEQYHFCVCLIDIDDFKHINDAYGHGVGDKVLQECCKIIIATLRKVDYFGRIGGEEFLVVEPYTDLDQGQRSAERLRAAIEKANFDHIIPNLKVTISVGATLYGWPERTAQLLKRVDAALYAAKERGRNCVVTA